MRCTSWFGMCVEDDARRKSASDYDRSRQQRRPRASHPSEGAAVGKCSSPLPSPAPRETSDPCIHGSDDGGVMRRAPLEGFVFGGGDQLEGLVAGVPEW